MLKIIIGSTVFTASLFQNESADALKALLPLTINMTELNGNEKYFYLPNTLPANALQVDHIHAGDLMLYGDDCLVLFYKGFKTSYRYTKLGQVDEPSTLLDVLGKGNVTVTFELKK